MFETMYLKTTNEELGNAVRHDGIISVRLQNGSSVKMSSFSHGLFEFMGQAEILNFASYRFPCDQTDEQWMSSILGGDLI